MAKLSAYGRQEVVRIDRQVTPSDPYTIMETHIIAYMDDGTVLEKRKYQFSADAEHVRVTNWRKKARLKPDVTLERIVTGAIRAGWNVTVKRVDVPVTEPVVRRK